MRTTGASSSSVCNLSRAVYFRFSAPLARTGIKQSKLVVLLGFPNVVRPNESNLDSETITTNHFAEVWMVKQMYSQSNGHV